MNCVEFERILPEFQERAHTPEWRAHLNSCPSCSSLVADLDEISSQARLLVASDEPRPAVWDAIESRLREEGLIHLPEFVTPKVSSWSRWRASWLVPVAAALVIVAGIKLYHPARVGDPGLISQKAPLQAPPSPKPTVSREDKQLLDSVAVRIPAQRARYTADLDDANSFIRDAEQSMKDDPNDIYVQQMLINAYAQKQMLYELAVDRGGGQ